MNPYRFKINPFAVFLIITVFICQAGAISKDVKFVATKPKTGEGISKMLERFYLPVNPQNIALFKDLNKGRILKDGGLMKKFNYKLPIIISKYNGKSVASSLFIDDMSIIESIKLYNVKIAKNGLVRGNYKKTKLLWIPMYMYDLNLSDDESPKTDNKQPIKRSKTEIKKQPDNNKNKTVKSSEDIPPGKSDDSTGKNSKQAPKATKDVAADTSSQIITYPLLGKKEEKIRKIGNKLKGHVIYLDPGHGGPDPGAIGHSGINSLCEDEYAYDVILRLAKALLQNGATVYIAVQDTLNGIRDEQFLKCDENEVYLGGRSISQDKKERLRQRTAIINELYRKNEKTAISQCNVTIHLDSRPTKQRIDIFYYYKPGSKKGMDFANTLYRTVKEKYDRNQPGRGYKGTVTSRNLYMLRNLLPTSVYIELGNLQNKKNQVRFTNPNNRQAIANWLCDGIMRYELK